MTELSSRKNTTKEVKNIKNKSDNKTLHITDFGGIDLRDTHKNPLGTSRLVNLRTSSDGSLVRRDGIRQLGVADGDVRAVWSGFIWGRYRCMMLVNNMIYDLNITSGAMNSITQVLTSSGPAEFFYYRGGLYMVDGTGIYAVKLSSLSIPFGYVPLIGKDWSDNQVGEIYQPRNLLNNCGRFSYVISAYETSVLRFDDYIDRIDAMYVNGVAIGSDRYSIGSSAPYVTVSGLHEGDRVVVYVTYRNPTSGLDELKSCTRAVVFGGISNSRPFLYGGSNKALMFSSHYISDKDVAESKKIYQYTDELYFPVGYEFLVGDGQYGISTVSRHYDRLLIFTEGGVWQADSSSCGFEDFPVMNINVNVGVKSAFGAALLGNSPCAVGKDGIYRFNANTDELDDCNAYSISEGIAPMLSPQFLESAFVYADTKKSELLFSAPDVSEYIFVYSDITHKWTTFKGFYAHKFFDLNGVTAFSFGSRIYVFDSDMDSDAGTPIETCFEGNIADFLTDKKKHISSMEVCFDSGTVECGIRLDGKTSDEYVLTVSAASEHVKNKKRVSLRRFDYLTPIIKCPDNSCRCIHSLTITTR